MYGDCQAIWLIVKPFDMMIVKLEHRVGGGGGVLCDKILFSRYISMNNHLYQL